MQEDAALVNAAPPYSHTNDSHCFLNLKQDAYRPLTSKLQLKSRLSPFDRRKL